MPYFAYKGRNQKGTLVKGVLESADSSSLASILFSQSITPIEIKTTRAPNTTNDLNNIQLFKEKVKTIDVMLFSRQMYTLLKAGIPIMKALGGLESTTQNKALKVVVGELRESLDGGRELSSAMQAHPKVFDNFYINMVKVGETTGLLDNVFKRMFHHLEFERFMNDQIKSALRYPTFVVIAMAVAMIVVNIFVIPAFAQVFEGMGTDLPFLTKVLLGFSDFMVAYWPFMLVSVIALFYAFKQYTRTESGKLKWDTLKLKFPIAGKIIHKGTMARFARSYALAGQSGVPITNALQLVSDTVDNAHIALKVSQMREGVERGESILQTATNAEVFNPMVLQMIAVGEESGSLNDLMEEVAEMYQRDVEYEIKTLGAQIEPIMIMFLGALVLVLALGIFVPIWDLGSIASGK
jgi:MSHA biogenesis protein MshG